MGIFDLPNRPNLQEQFLSGPALAEEVVVKKPAFRSTNAPRYEVVKEYNTTDECISTSPGWVMAVIRLAKPLTYSRRLNKSIGDPASGAFLRQSKPLIIFDDCTHLSISRPTGQPLKTLNAAIKSSSVNYLSANAILPGDWIFAWCHNDVESTKKLIPRILNGEACNKFNDGLKFFGRVHNIRKRVSVNEKVKTASYSLQAIGFSELETSFFYDIHLATPAAMGGAEDIGLFMSQIGLDYIDFIGKTLKAGGNIEDNMSDLISSLLDSVIGKGGTSRGDEALTAAYKHAGLDIPQVHLTSSSRTEAPYSYLVPSFVAQLLGKTPVDKSRPSQVFCCADLFHLLIGVQQYSPDKDSLHKGFWPIVGPRSTANRSILPDPIKGTFLPQAIEVINIPVWKMIAEQFLNQAINQAYTALKVGPDGNITPTIVVRQIPFSSNQVNIKVGGDGKVVTDGTVSGIDVALTKFLHLPRWVIDPVMVKDFDVGRSDATKFNMIKILGDPKYFPHGASSQPADEMVRNPPVFDTVDIARCGIKPYTQTINCTPGDITRPDGLEVWTRMVADWWIGSQHTLNGTIQCVGIQSPIAEGDNIEFEGIVYHIDSISDACIISPTGSKTFITTLSLTHGMPAVQDNDAEFPTYPGFSALEMITSNKSSAPDGGDDTVLTSQDPGMSEDRI